MRRSKEVGPTSELQPRSGLVSSEEFVRYNVKEVFKGEAPDGQIRVAFMPFINSLTADVNRTQLSPAPFRKKNVHLRAFCTPSD